MASVCGSQGGASAASPSRRIRRTVLRDSLSRRLISRSVCPCALRTRTLLRISLGMMLGMVFDVVAKGVKADLQAKNGVHHGPGQWTERRQSFAQARDDHVEAPQIGLARAFRAVAQALAGMLLGTVPHGLDEQVRVADQTVAGGVTRSLVMHEPAAQRAGGQRRVGHARRWRAPTGPPRGRLPSSTAGPRAPPREPRRGARRAVASAGSPSWHHARSGGRPRAATAPDHEPARAPATPPRSPRRAGFGCAPARRAGPRPSCTASTPPARCRGRAGAAPRHADSHRSGSGGHRPHRPSPRDRPPQCTGQSGPRTRSSGRSAPPRAAPPGGRPQSAAPGDADQDPGTRCPCRQG